VIAKYKDDESNTPTQTVLMMLMGGGRNGGVHGAHLGPGVRMRYAAADKKRQNIPWVEYRNADTRVTRTYLASDAKPDSVRSLPTFEMQCVDCHNRPTHTFELPERAMDKAMAGGDIPVTLPFVKKKGVEVLKAGYGSSEAAAAKIPAALAGFYQQNYPNLYARRAQDIGQAGKAPRRETDGRQNEKRAQGHCETNPERTGQTAPARPAEARAGHQLGHEPEQREHGSVEQDHENAAHQQRKRPAEIDSRMNGPGTPGEHQRVLAAKSPTLPPPARTGWISAWAAAGWQPPA
jgi:hypothetical protein